MVLIKHGDVRVKIKCWFSQVAELINVCWLEINGSMNTQMLSQNKVYVVYLVFKLTARHYRFDYRPQHVLVGVGGSDPKTQAMDSWRLNWGSISNYQ